jgi:uncharacterized membrane protein HdeD (DUF308 family)
VIATTAAEREALRDVSRRWYLRILVGVLFLVFGFIVFGYDERSVAVLSIFIGVSFALTGLSWLLIAALVEEVRVFFLVIGLLALGGSIAAFVWPDETLKILSLMLGWFLLLGGIAQFALAVMQRDREGWWLGVVFGVLQFGLGAWALGETERSVVLFATLVGIYCVVKGVFELIAGFELRRLKHRLERPIP